MPIVPQYQPGQVQQRGVSQQGISVRASADDMGAAVGRGMQSLGQGVGEVANAMVAVAEMENVALAKQADNEFAGWLRERQYGEGGFLTLEGRNAVQGRDQFEREVADKRREFGQGLNPGAQAAFDRASTARVNSTLDQSIVHTANQRKAWFKDASTQRIDTFAEDALAGYANPNLVARNIAAGQAELRSMAEMQGWDPDALANREAEFVSGVHKNIALRLAQADPLAADAYRKQHNDSLTGPDQYQLESSLQSAVLEAEAVRVVDGILQGTRTPPSGAPGGGVTVGETGPTNTRAFLNSRLVTQGRTEDVDGLDEGFATNIAAMMQDAPPEIAEGLGILSGARSVERQRVLWEQALVQYGSPEAARKWVAPPGNSRHNFGQAVDLSWNGRSLKHAPPEVIDWVHANAEKYGMHFPMDHEPWHAEPVGSRSGTVAPRGTGVAPRSMMPSASDIEAQLAGIADPRVRDLARTRLNAQVEAQNRAAAAAEKAAKEELWRYVEGGATPDQVPQDVRVAAGLSSVSSAWSYIEATAARGVPQDDENLTYDMRRFAADKPDEFAQIDLNEYRDRLSPGTFKEMTGLQTGALTDQRKAREEGTTLTTAFSQATTELEALGITTTGKNGSQRQEAATRIAQFNNVLAAQIAEFKAREERNPDQADIQSMVNRLLLPIVIEEPGRVYGTRRTEGNFLFEADTVANAADVSVSVEYGDIPRSLRIEIEADLAAELGRNPSEDEVSARYNQVIEETIRDIN